MANKSLPSTNGSAIRSEVEGASITAEEFKKSFGEDLRQTLDVTNWRVGEDLTQEVDRIEIEVRQSVQHEEWLYKAIREQVFPKLKSYQTGPKNAGHYVARKEDLLAVQRGLLFNGGVEACDGCLRIHDTLPLTIYQIGISLVSYKGDRGSWFQRLFRRDLKQFCEDPLLEALAILEGRAKSKEVGFGELVQKTLLSYAERAVLLRHSDAVWRMGHGDPAPYELLTGGGNMELMEAGINILREMIEDQPKFVFVANPPKERLLFTIGQALDPWEFAIVSTLKDRLEFWLHQNRFTADAGRVLSWDGEPLAPSRWIPRFINEVAPKVVVGVFRATRLSPALVFYAHEDHADIAAHLAIADGMFQEQRGFPLLIDLARHVKKTVFGDSLDELADSAYAAAGTPWRYRTV